MSLFITGTDTGVGKTYTAARLLHLLRASGASCAGMKPMCCGDRRDAELLLASGSDGLTIDDVNPLWLKTPAAPVVGSLMEKVDIDIEHILAAFHSLQNRVEHVIVEGTGGWMVPIHRDYFVSDLAVAMKLPVLAVAYNRLGCLNHAQLTRLAIEARGVSFAGWIASGVDPAMERTAENLASLERLLGEPAVAIAPCEPGGASSLTLEAAATRLVQKAISF